MIHSRLKLLQLTLLVFSLTQIRADTDITLIKVNDTTNNVQVDWDDSEGSFVVKGGKLH